jgi:hypothetical protein
MSIFGSDELVAQTHALSPCENGHTVELVKMEFAKTGEPGPYGAYDKDHFILTFANNFGKANEQGVHDERFYMTTDKAKAFAGKRLATIARCCGLETKFKELNDSYTEVNSKDVTNEFTGGLSSDLGKDFCDKFVAMLSGKKFVIKLVKSEYNGKVSFKLASRGNAFAPAGCPLPYNPVTDDELSSNKSTTTSTSVWG